METPGPVPPTPHRELRDDDLFDEDNEEALPNIAVKDITDQFKAHGLFSFEGSTKYQDGKQFLQRFEGAIRTHPHRVFRTITQQTEEVSAPGTGAAITC